MAATWGQDAVFSRIVDIIERIFAETHCMVTHKEITSGVIADEVTKDIIKAQRQQDEQQTIEGLADDMVRQFDEYFAARGRRSKEEPKLSRRFDRYRSAGEWAYRPRECVDCGGIDKKPDHYCGEPVTDVGILRCVLYEAFTLAMTIQSLRSQTWSSEVTYQVPKGSYDPSEILKNAALMKIRLLFDFLYKEEGDNDIGLSRKFSEYGFELPLDIPKELSGFQGCGEFNKQSINKFIAHLTNARITKPKCIPQPKFEKGQKATIANAIAILRDVEKVVTKVMEHPKCGKLGKWGESFLNGFRTAMSRIDGAKPTRETTTSLPGAESS